MVESGDRAISEGEGEGAQDGGRQQQKEHGKQEEGEGSLDLASALREGIPPAAASSSLDEGGSPSPDEQEAEEAEVLLRHLEVGEPLLE